jgi:hypothetical protein
LSQKIKKNLIILIGVLISIFLSTVIWDKILLDFKNPGNVIGVYSDNFFNKNNNLVRYLFFTLFPIFTFLMLTKITWKDKVNKLSNIYVLDHPRYNHDKKLFGLLIIIIIFSFINFILSDFPLHKIDILHEGLALGNGYNSKITKSFWINTFTQNSFFSDFINPRIAWFLHGYETIGAYRFNHIFLRLITEIFLIIFIYEYIKILNFKKNLKIIGFLILGLLSIYLNQKLTESFYPVRFRDLATFVFLIFTIKLITSENNKTIISVCVGVTGFTAVLWSLDRGIYISAALMCLLFFLFIRKDYYKFYLIFISYIFSLIIFMFLVGYAEFSNFIRNGFYIIQNQDLFNGLIHPTPFDFEGNTHAARGTKNLLIIIINGILISSIIFSRQIHISVSAKAFILFFFILAFINYKSGIARADSYHMRQSIFIHLVILISILLILFQKILNKDLVFKKNYLFLMTVFCLFVFIYFSQIKVKNFKRFVQYQKDYVNYISLEDKVFLSEEYIKLISRLKNYNLSCVQVFSYDAVLTYLLKKNSCTKFNYIYILSSENLQNIFITDLENKKPQYILTKNTYKNLSGFSPDLRFKVVKDFIKENYNVREEILDWKIYEIK